MANMGFNNVQAPETEVKFISANFTGVNGAAVTAFEGAMESITRAGEGDWDIVLKDKYKFPAGTMLACGAEVVGAAGDHAHVSAYDLEAGTVTITGWTAAGAADDLDAKVVHFWYMVRNSTSRRP